MRGQSAFVCLVGLSLATSHVIAGASPAVAAVCSFPTPSPLPSADSRIESAEDLHWLRNTTSAWSGTWTQTANIDMGGCEWTSPIGTSATKFTGVYNGGGFVISGLTISMSGQNDVGLFGWVGTGQVRDLGFTGAVVGGRYVGGLVGRNEGTITNSYATGSVSATDRQVGGLIGYNVRGSVTKSYATGSVSSAGNGEAGGLIGYEEQGTVTDSYASGNVTGQGFVGGLIGYADRGTYSRVFATGSATGTSTYVGGLIGYDFGGPITNSYARGNATGTSFVGGLVGGTANAASAVSNSYATGTATGTGGNVGGLIGAAVGAVTNSFRSGLPNSGQGTAKTLSEMQDIATFTVASWNITSGWTASGSIWGICARANDGLPILNATYVNDPCSSGSGDSQSSGSGIEAPPIVVRQGVPLPLSGTCLEVIDAEFAYGTGLTGGWQRGWEMWVGPPGVGGYACIRMLVKLSGKPWRVDNAGV